MEPTPKICPECDKPLVQRPKERAAAFEQRIYCARACHRRALRNGKQKLRAIKLTGHPGSW